jgi:hypothetical protein
MNVDKYLKQYNRDADRLLRWIVQNGGDKATAFIIIDSFANIEKYFPDGNALDNAILKECHDDEKKSISEIVDKYKRMNWKPNTMDVIKNKVKQWTQKQ